MFKEALQEITAAAVKAAGPQHKEIDPTKTYAVVTDGKVELIGNQVPWRKHTAQDLETIAAFADKFTSAAIWVSRRDIVLLVNDDDRRERVYVEMIQSDEIDRLGELGEAKPLLDQRAILFMLRTVFTQDALPKFPKLIDTLRSVKFEAQTSADSKIERGKSSVGKALNVHASGLESVPEQVTLSVPIFENSFATLRVDVQCALEIYEAEQRLQLFPLPGEVEGAYAKAESHLCELIRDLLGKDSAVPVYYGSP